MSNQEFSQNLFRNILDLWISPEIKRRRQANTLPENFQLKGAVVFLSDRGNSPPSILLNQEAELTAELKLKNGIVKVKGDPVKPEEIESIVGLIPSAVLNNHQSVRNKSYVAIYQWKPNEWTISFDFRYNKSEAKEHLAAAKEFCQVAEYSHANGLKRSFFDNAFSSCELATMAVLITLPQGREKHDSHHARLETLSEWCKLGNQPRFVFSTQNTLWSLRKSARYLSSKEYSTQKPEDILNELRTIIKLAEESLS